MTPHSIGEELEQLARHEAQPQISGLHLIVSLKIFGHAEPAGSKRAFAVKRKGVPTGQITVVDANPRATNWKQEVSAQGAQAMAGRRLIDGPVQLTLTFFAKRPRSHYGRGKNSLRVRPGAAAYPTTRPDASKLTRAVEDALTGIIWRDDAQIVEQHIRKVYGEPERCECDVSILGGARPGEARRGEAW